MTTVHAESGTNVHEIAAGIFRISVPVPPSAMPGGFTFNQFLLVDDEPLLFHTGPHKMFPLVRQAVAHVLGDVTRLKWVGFSHVEADECGALNEWLEAAPQATPVCSQVAAMVSVSDFAIRPARALARRRGAVAGEASACAGSMRRTFPHNWECGYLNESTTRTLLCGDLFTHGGADGPPITESEVLGPSEAFRQAMPAGSVAIERGSRAILEKLAATEPRTLALMHGSSYRGDGAKLLRGLADVLDV